MREWQTVDTKIFEKANETLWKKIENFGFDRMEEEVRELEKINLANAENCVDSYMPVKSLPVEFRSDLIFTWVYKRHALSSRKKIFRGSSLENLEFFYNRLIYKNR